ncbi:uncharacterized protein CC84DRAFT_113303 [Paraphaeosphaeria sporulosa]|uniref:DUF218 domain-containing protein n=1 Tax=Paraphaeosphaeria sporulosa TaxID=1460663 RepID=A0A177CXQ4_9PLEO|nr:uncharacterized protein CC84DRAFT_113303 [Paraphaeosphaeria sporulosa]OAG12335.1 hypothetical protein CC84DRAFT_113303 [Paraphaeosphaeria sporulosa]
MATPATPSRILPKSNFHNANAATNTGVSIAPDAESKGASLAYQRNNDFEHPDHVIPPPDYTGFENLVIVCCHGIFHPDASSPDFPLYSPHDENNWYLADFQKSNPETGKPGEQETFLAHALAGIDALIGELSPDVPNRTLLVMSGGSTKPSLTPLSEARSYYHAALAHELAEGNRGGGRTYQLFSKGRILLEEHAADSFQNLLFSILLFRQTTGRYPKQIRVITHAFKARRFLDLHAPSIRWPSERIQVQGIDPVMSGAEREQTIRGEEKHGFAPWLQDQLGTGDFLASKRRNRGWDEQVAEQLAEGLEVSAKEVVKGTVPEHLPWESTVV